MNLEDLTDLILEEVPVTRTHAERIARRLLESLNVYSRTLPPQETVEEAAKRGFSEAKGKV